MCVRAILNIPKYSVQAWICTKPNLINTDRQRKKNQQTYRCLFRSAFFYYLKTKLSHILMPFVLISRNLLSTTTSTFDSLLYRFTKHCIYFIRLWFDRLKYLFFNSQICGRNPHENIFRFAAHFRHLCQVIYEISFRITNTHRKSEKITPKFIVRRAQGTETTHVFPKCIFRMPSTARWPEIEFFSHMLWTH